MVETCNCCGAVIPIPEPELRLTPSERRLYDFIAKHPGVPFQRIYDHMYAHRYDGGPERNTINTMMSHINDKLAGHKIRRNHLGWDGTYWLVLEP